MERKDYNGWTNYETWNVNLWMTNDQGSSEHFANMAQEEWDQAGALDPAYEGQTRKQQTACNLADHLKEWHEEALPELEGFAADLLNAAMSEVNWYEIAENLLEEYPETEPAETEEA
jgi:hypothetical protein